MIDRTDHFYGSEQQGDMTDAIEEYDGDDAVRDL